MYSESVGVETGASSEARGSLTLASASPRRRKILEACGLSFRVVVPEVEEVHWHGDPEGTVTENAARKCRWACERYPLVTVIAADTVVVFNGESIGKPKSYDEAVTMLEQFSGCSQMVYTGVAMGISDQPLQQSTTKSRVHFRELNSSDIEAYFRRVDPLDKAGGYDIDQHSDLIIRDYEGSWTNIMGLPRAIVEAWLTCK